MKLVARLSCVLVCNSRELAITSARNNLVLEGCGRGVERRRYINCSRACHDDVTGGEVTAFATTKPVILKL
jgi:hypothetical protein